jgi:flagellin
MGLYINTNTSSLNARRRLTDSTNALGRSFERLSSGLRINSAKDDAAGLAITNRMTAQIRGLDQAVRNSNDGISMAQTAEGALQEATNLIQRMRELAVQAANDSNNESDRMSLQEEVTQLIAEVDRIASSTNFNGNKILDGSIINNVMQVGANVGETLSVRISEMSANELGRQMRRDSSIGVDTSVDIDGSNLVINGTAIRMTVASDDVLSTANNSGSAIAKANAINDAFGFTGVRAIAGPTETVGRTVGGGVLNETNFFTINGQKFGGFTLQANDSDGTLVDAINSAFGETGVLANLDAAGQLVLTAEDGRNIDVTVANAFVANATGLLTASQVSTGTLPVLTTSTIGALAIASTYSFSVSGAAGPLSTDVSIQGRFTSDDVLALTINGAAYSVDLTTIGAPGSSSFNFENLPFSPALPGEITSALTGVVLNFADLTGDETGASFSLEFGGGFDSLTEVSGGKITLQSNKAADITFGSFINAGLGNIRGDVPPNDGVGLAIFGTTTDSSVNDVNITTRQGAVKALDILDLAIDQIASQRASLGAIQNRLESTINSLTTNSENLSASRSRILDADFATETANLSRNQIIQQAGVSILAQANQQPQIALSLLGG